jgi:hypothetical protein
LKSVELRRNGINQLAHRRHPFPIEGILLLAGHFPILGRQKQ